MSMVSTKPYLIRAIYEWCVDQGFTPHVAVIVDEHVMVPPGYARDGQIVLDLSPDATNKLVLGNEEITFQARFGGVAHNLLLPISHVVAVYAGENGHGMAFEPELPAGATPPVVEDEAADVPEARPVPVLSAVDASGDDEPPAPPAGGDGADSGAPRRGHLKVVK